MLSELDLPSVRRFTDELTNDVRRCDNGEGAVCSTLESRIEHYARLCKNLRDGINRWTRAIFAGEIAFDEEVETLLKSDVRFLLEHAAQLAAQGAVMYDECYILGQVPVLNYFVADFQHLIKNWTSPRLAVSPSPRVEIGATAEAEIARNIENLN